MAEPIKKQNLPAPGRAANTNADDPALDPRGSDTGPAGPPVYQSVGWARAVGPDGATAEAWLQKAPVCQESDNHRSPKSGDKAARCQTGS